MRAKLAAFAGALTACILLLFAGVGTASATTTYVYPVYHYQVCQSQGSFGASLWNPWDPYSWYCYKVDMGMNVVPPVPAVNVGPTGGLDIEGWCRRTYTGTHAELVSHDAFGWRCIRRE